MPFLQALVRCSITALFLVLCLQLVTGQDEDMDNRKPLIVQMSPIPRVKVNETTEVRCNVSTQLRECMVINFSLLTNKRTLCSTSFYDYQACICPGDAPRNFYWNICSQRPVTVVCMAEAVNAHEICDKNISVVPSKGWRGYSISMFTPS